MDFWEKQEKRKEKRIMRAILHDIKYKRLNTKYERLFNNVLHELLEKQRHKDTFYCRDKIKEIKKIIDEIWNNTTTLHLQLYPDDFTYNDTNFEHRLYNVECNISYL